MPGTQRASRNVCSCAPNRDPHIFELGGGQEISWTGVSQTMMVTQVPGDPVKSQILPKSAPGPGGQR